MVTAVSAPVEQISYRKSYENFLPQTAATIATRVVVSTLFRNDGSIIYEEENRSSAIVSHVPEGAIVVRV